MGNCLYEPKDLTRKANKLKVIFPYVGWSEIHELTPQVMEIVECVAIIRNASEEDKKTTVIAVIDKLLNRVKHVDGVRESIPGLYDVINNASKGMYAINKEQTNEKDV